MKCKHDKNWVITEEYKAWANWFCENGIIDRIGVSGDDGPSGKYYFRCRDCGFKRLFTKNNMPKHIATKMKALGI